MPTSRAYSLLTAALVLYLFANQTQVGWLYVAAALLAGTVIGAWLLSRGALRGIDGERRIGGGLNADLYEGDDAAIELALRKAPGMGTSQIRLAENCPLAAPDSPFRTVKMFIPSLPGDSAVRFAYEVTLDRRGLHEFPPVTLASQVPFGLFKHEKTLPLTTRVLVYPEVRRLERLDLLDRRLTAQVSRPRAGVGDEVLGVRPYRAGDSPRHIHWHSVARTGQLMSKEFADEAQPGLTLALDVFAHPYPLTDSKHTPFEWAVKAAASIGDYAARRGYLLHLLVDDEALAAPRGPVTEAALLQYLARLQPTGRRPFPSILGSQPTQTFVAVLLAWPDESVIEPLLDLRARRLEVLAVLLDPDTFPAGGPSARRLAGQLQAAGISVNVVAFQEQPDVWEW